jgi:hypothetical protein
MHPMDLELMTSPSTLPLQGKEVPFELELIGSPIGDVDHFIIKIQCPQISKLTRALMLFCEERVC